MEWCESKRYALWLFTAVCYLISFSFFRHIWKEWEKRRKIPRKKEEKNAHDLLCGRYFYQFSGILFYDRHKFTVTMTLFIRKMPNELNKETVNCNNSNSTQRRKEANERKKKDEKYQWKQKFQQPTIYAKWSIDKPIAFIVSQIYAVAAVHSFNAHRQPIKIPKY